MPHHVTAPNVDHFGNTQLVWIDDSYTLIPIDQPETLTDHLRTFLTAHT